MKKADFIDLDVSQLQALSTKQLKIVAQEGAKIANPRIQRLAKNQMTAAPAYAALPSKVKKSGGYATKGLSRQQLINSIRSQQTFVKARTSTVGGWKATQKAAAARAQAVITPKAKVGYNVQGQPVVLKPGQKSALTNRQQRIYWDLFNKMQESNKIGERGSYDKTQIGQIIVSVIKAHPRSNYNEEMEKELAARITEYEQEQNAEESRTREDIYSES